MSEFKQRVLDIDRQDWFSSLSMRKSIRLYKLIKLENYVEPYTYLVDHFYQRKYIAKLRCGVLEVRVNKGRLKNIVYNERICKFCSDEMVDDEIHFIFNCSFHNSLRINIFPEFFLNNDVDVNQRLQVLFSSNSKAIFISLARFIMLALRDRRDVS